MPIFKTLSFKEHRECEYLLFIANHRADSVRFLWVALQIHDICALTCDEDIRDALKKLPKDLPETYDRALYRVVREQKAHVAEKVYRWIAVVQRPLSLEELREAIAVEPKQTSLRRDRLVNNMNQLVAWCGNLVTIDEEDNSVRFAHHSVRDYLCSDCSDPYTQRFHFKIPEVNQHVGEVCVSYLDFTDFKRELTKAPKPIAAPNPKQIAAASLSSAPDPSISRLGSKLNKLWIRKQESRVNVSALRFATMMHRAGEIQELERKYIFLNYASQHWLSHTRTFSRYTSTWNLWKQLISTNAPLAKKPWTADEWAAVDKVVADYILDQDHVALLVALQPMEDFVEWPTQCQQMLPNASGRGLDQLVEVMLGSAMVSDEVLDASLCAAIRAGHSQVVQRLLAAGADVNAAPAADFGCTALQAAAELGHEEVVQRLLEAGVDVNAAPARFDGRTALQAAAEGGHREVVQQLLDAGADVNAAPVDDGSAVDRGLTALQAAAEFGNEELVQRLLEAGADVNAAPVNGGSAADCGLTALQAATGGGHREVVQQLLEAGADVDAAPASYHGRTALQAAAEGGHREVVQQLLEAGAHVNAAPARFDGRTALQAAAEGGHREMVQQLLEAGADVNAASAIEFGRTALQAAAERGHLELVQQLLGAGADVNAQASPYGHTALQAAAAGGHREVERLLKRAGAKE